MDYLWANVRLGHVALYEGNLTEAREVLSETARNFHKDGHTIGLVFTLELMASLSVAVGKPENAAQLIGWADATRETHDAPRLFLEQSVVDRDAAAVVARVGKDAYKAAYNKGCIMTLEEAFEYALYEG
jgi:hypothetical protein